jgi:hypothetical protein
MWSYPGIYRDQGKSSDNLYGKEVCDLLVIFGSTVIIFSDKYCAFPETQNLHLDWSRWFRRAIWKSSKQLLGAQRWIREFPERLFVDRACSARFPLDISSEEELKFHLIVVAHDSSMRCRATLGGSGSLMIVPSISGKDHFNRPLSEIEPFAIGDLYPSKSYIHVLDDVSLDLLLGTLDTISDLVAYLSAKEEFIRSGKLVSAAGEEDLLAYYLGRVDKDHRHHFRINDGFDFISIDDGFWQEFSTSPQRLAQLDANEVSYAWDFLIEEFSKHILQGTQHYRTHSEISELERIVRFMAREPRTRRRMLARSLLDMLATTPQDQRRLRVIAPSFEGDPYIVLLLLPNPPFIKSEDEYREGRRSFLEACCMVTKLKFPDAKDILGIATESGQSSYRSEDAIYIDAREWTEVLYNEARELQDRLSILTDYQQFAETEFDYPKIIETSGGKMIPLSSIPKGFSRNRPCPCGSGQKFKFCHGITVPRKKRKRRRK